LAQTLPIEQVLFAQQGWLGPPQAVHTRFRPHPVPAAVQTPPVQHG
jgi:hypothetical protein